MKKTFIFSVCAAVFAFALTLVSVSSTPSLYAQDAPAAQALPRTLVPAHKMDLPWWKQRHEANCARIAQGNVDLLLIGDSITHGWDSRGKEVQDFFYGDRNFVNMGFGGDQTQHVLWRLENAPMDKIQPKAAVLLIGINSLWKEWPNCTENVALGIKACVDKLQALYPDIKILVLNIFAAQNPDSGCRARAAETNKLLPGIFKDYKNVQLLDINDLWLDKDGNIPKNLMGDLVHPGREGYILWGNRVDPIVAEMLGVEPKVWK